MVPHAILWNGSPSSWVDLHPAGAQQSFAYKVGGSQQVGVAVVSGANHASLWRGMAISWIDLNPPGASASNALSTNGMHQVGNVLVSGISRASLWSGTASSWVDLHKYLPPRFTYSYAFSISPDGDTICGFGFNSQSGVEEALLWTKADRKPVGWTTSGPVAMEPSNLRVNLGSLPTGVYTREGGNYYTSLSKHYWASKRALQLTGEPGGQVRVWVEVISSTGHDHHTASRHRGWITTSASFAPAMGPGTTGTGSSQNVSLATALTVQLSPSGTAALYYIAPEIAGREKIRATYGGAGDPIQDLPILVRYAGFGKLTFSEGLSPYGQALGHSERFHGLLPLRQALAALGKNYRALTSKNLGINDMSLPEGGLFDLDRAFGYGPDGKGGHIGHKLGVEVDVSIKPDNTAEFTAFRSLLEDQGWWIVNDKYPKIHSSHLHLNLTGSPKGKPVVRLDPTKSATLTRTSAGNYDIRVPLISRGGVHALAVSVTGMKSSNSTVRLTTPIPAAIGNLGIGLRKTLLVKAKGKAGSTTTFSFTVVSKDATGAPHSMSFSLPAMKLP